MRKLIILLGPPGCGKGTQADRLSKKFNYPHISTGAMLRDEIDMKTPLGLEAKGYVEAGKLGPDRLIYDILFSRIARDDCKGGAILDGFPRNLEQAEVLREHLLENDDLLAINFVLDDNTIIERMSGRRLCSTCGASYHLEHAPPKEPGICDSDGGDLYQRSDDSPAVVANRLNIFTQSTAPLIEYYRKSGQLIDVDCNGKTIDKIFSEVQSLTS